MEYSAYLSVLFVLCRACFYGSRTFKLEVEERKNKEIQVRFRDGGPSIVLVFVSGDTTLTLFRLRTTISLWDAARCHCTPAGRYGPGQNTHIQWGDFTSNGDI